MNINIKNVPKSIIFWISGIFVTYLLWEYIPDILDVLADMGLVANWSDYTPIMWFGLILVSIILTIGLPAWVLFEEDKE